MQCCLYDGFPDVTKKLGGRGEGAAAWPRQGPQRADSAMAKKHMIDLVVSKIGHKIRT